MDIQKIARERAKNILDELNNTGSSIMREGFPLFMANTNTRNHNTMVWNWDSKILHPYEQRYSDKKLIRVSSRVNLLNLLIRHSLGMGEGIEETLDLFKTGEWPDQFPNSIMYSMDRELAEDRDHVLSIDELIPYIDNHEDRFSSFRTNTRRADAYGGILLVELGSSEQSDIVKLYKKNPGVLTVKYDCDDMGRSYDMMKTSLAGFMLALNGEKEAAKEYLDAMFAMNNNRLLIKDIDDSPYNSNSGPSTEGDPSKCAIAYLLDFALGGERYEEFYQFMTEKFPVDSIIPSKINMAGALESVFTTRPNTCYSIFLNAIGKKEEAFARMDFLDKYANDPNVGFCNSLIGYSFNDINGPEDMMNRALAYAEISKESSVFLGR